MKNKNLLGEYKMCEINILMTRDVCIICWKEIIIFKKILMKSIMPREIKDEYKNYEKVRISDTSRNHICVKC